MPETITLNCPACGKPVQLHLYKKQIACPNCGYEIVLKAGSDIYKIISDLVIIKLPNELDAMRKQLRELMAFIQQCDVDVRTIRRKERALALARFFLILFAAMIGFYVFFNAVVDVEKTVLVCNACLFRIANVLNGCLGNEPRGQLFTGLFYASAIWSLFLFVVFALRARNLPDKYVKDVEQEKQEAIEQLVEVKKQIEEKELLLEEYRTAMLIM